MKTTSLFLILFLMLIFCSSLLKTTMAETLTHKVSQNKIEKIEIEKLKGFHVNLECIQNKKECWALISAPKTITKTPSLENPASFFCEKNHGTSFILQDKKYNEYDYCLLEKKFFIDSWDFYKLNKK